jgi:spermidine synthase
VSSALLFLSGFAALVYQVLWMRDLAVLFGNSAHAAAVTLAVFFGGIAAGAALFARVSPRIANPLRAYGFLELGIAASALLFFLLLDIYGWLYAPLYERFSDRIAILIAIKAALACGVLGVPTMFMGATLPAMVQHRGSQSAWLYGMNTAGATLGAFAAGFYLPPTLGFRGSYALAVTVNLIAGAIAIATSRTAVETQRPESQRLPVRAQRLRVSAAPAGEGSSLSRADVTLLASASGALTIGLEVVWLRMFAQVLDHSVYGFSAVIVVALVAFALASMLVSVRAASVSSRGSIAIFLGLAALIVSGLPEQFIAWTDGLTQIQSDSWSEYIRQVFVLAAAFVGPAGLVSGLVFPALLRAVRSGAAAGADVGRLLFVNTAGAIVGSIGTTFVLLPLFGLWRTIAGIAVAYAVLAAATALRSHVPVGVRPCVLIMSAGAVLFAVTGASQPRIRLDAARGETVRELWESSHGTVAVTEGKTGLVLRMNNSYSLGGTVDRIERERIQAFLPIVLHPSPSRVFFLGLGTGITAGEAVRHPLERIVVCELVPEVALAAKQYFGPWIRGLGRDPRVDIRAEDGRQYLAASRDEFDVIVSDLFVPWHAGTGTLYTREHFETVRARLRHGGLFAQWLPLFQLNERDFEVIARTLSEVFPHVALWRGDFYANRPIVALVASVDPVPIDPARLVSNVERVVPGLSREAILAGVLPFYGGNLGVARGVLGDGAINTDEHPVIEYLSPTSQWSGRTGGTPWFVSMPLVQFYERLHAAAPIGTDPNLAALSTEERRFVEAGTFYYRAIVERLRDENEAAEHDLAEALQRLPARIQVGGPFLAMEPLVQ